MKTSKEYVYKAASASWDNAWLWHKYLRKFVSKNGVELSRSDLEEVLESNKLTGFQKITLKQANIVGSKTHQYITSLNNKAKSNILERLRKNVDL
jgi:hypothetical protein